MYITNTPTSMKDYIILYQLAKEKKMIKLISDMSRKFNVIS